MALTPGYIKTFYRREDLTKQREKRMNERLNDQVEKRVNEDGLEFWEAITDFIGTGLCECGRQPTGHLGKWALCDRCKVCWPADGDEPEELPLLDSYRRIEPYFPGINIALRWAPDSQEDLDKKLEDRLRSSPEARERAIEIIAGSTVYEA